MSHSFSLYCLLVFVCTYHQFCEANRFLTTKNTVHYVSEIYPKLCENNAATHRVNLTEAQKKLLLDLQGLSIDDYHNDDDDDDDDDDNDDDDTERSVIIFNKIAGLISNTGLIEKFKNVVGRISTTGEFYDQFLKIFKNYHEYSPTYVKDFIITTTSESIREFKFLLDDLQNVFDDFWTQSIIKRINQGIEQSNPICLESLSLQQLLNEFYRIVAISHIQGLFVIIHSYCMDEKIYHVNHDFFKKSMIDEYKLKMLRNLAKIKEVTQNVSREVFRCDSTKFKYDETYSKLGSVFQAHFIYEKRPFYKVFSSIKSCESIRHETIHCTNDRCKNQPQDKICKGNLRDCQSIDDNMKFCIAPATTDRRYDWMTTGNGDLFGYQHYTLGCNDIQSVESSRLSLTDVCVCNCESEDFHEVRHFSLQSVTSDVNENKVITGLRWIKKGSVFYIQIQQGLLEAEGSININSVQWKEIDFKSTFSDNNTDSLASIRDSNDVYTVTNDENTVYLDDFDSRKDKLITGLRLQRTGKDLRLEIQETPFNFATGQLDEKSSSWGAKSNTTHERTEVELTGSDEPTRALNPSSKIEVSRSNQFVRFTMTDLKKDLGQHTVPYIDLREVITDPPTPLAGVGIFHSGRKGFGGFLSLKIIHYNFAYHSWKRFNSRSSPSLSN